MKWRTRRPPGRPQRQPARQPAPLRAHEQAERAERDTEQLLSSKVAATSADPAATTPGPPLSTRSPFLIALFATLGIALGLGFVLMIRELTDVITYLVVAMFIALGIEPIVSALTRRGVPRAVAVLLAFVAVAVVVALFAWLIVPTIVDQVSLLTQNAPGYVRDLQHTRWVQEANARWHISDNLLQLVEDGVKPKTVASLFGGVLGIGKALLHGLVGAFTVLVLTIYFVAAMPRVKTSAYKLAPYSRRPRVMYLSEEITRRVGSYIIGQLCVAVINGAFSYVILVILHLPFPAVLAVVMGLLALVPIVGTLVGATVMISVAFTAGWKTAVVVVAYYVFYHLFESYVLAPRIMSRAVEVPPVITIVAVLAGGGLAGILGALLAIPVAAALLLLYNEVLVPRQQRL